MHLPELNEIKDFWKEVVAGWSRSKTSRLGAALAYYTIFAVAPLLIVSITFAGLWFGKTEAREELFNQVNQLVGKEGGKTIQGLVTAAANRPNVGLWSAAGALGTLFAGATALFVELQDALNTIWCIRRKPGNSLRHFITDRVLSFGMVLGIGFLLLVSLVLNTAISAVGKFAGNALPQANFLWPAINFLASLAVITLLFAMMLKVLPDAKIAWRDVWLGAFLTALLFNIGKHLIGTYLGRSSMVSVYGAAGSFIVLLLWIYYSAQILFFGAEFTHVYARRHGRHRDEFPCRSDSCEAAPEKDHQESSQSEPSRPRFAFHRRSAHPRSQGL